MICNKNEWKIIDDLTSVCVGLANHMTANDIPSRIDDETPQQAIVSAMRKYSK